MDSNSSKGQIERETVFLKVTVQLTHVVHYNNSSSGTLWQQLWWDCQLLN